MFRRTLFKQMQLEQVQASEVLSKSDELDAIGTLSDGESVMPMSQERPYSGHSKHAAFNKRKQSGFTLLELMVVLVILGALIGLIAPNILGRADEAKVTVAKTQMRDLVNALNLYKLDNGNFPSTAQGLEALVSKPSGFPEARNWKSGGYLSKLPKDPWSNEFVYVSPGSTGDYDLISLGSDGREGGDDDAEDLSASDL
ncbi:type II secretion system major pseudopilin GspG [Marinomonas mediterranea]|uniref:type II secretion system major pseudopilin GspG n=1 Tax=Marinomonas mediterranea TaxID=119864 RepID=UPI00300E05E4